VKAEPGTDATTESELLHGEPVAVYEEREGWAWVQSGIDDYVGYVEAKSLGAAEAPATHRVSALSTFLYPEPDLRRPPRGALSLGCRLALGDTVEVRDTAYRLVVGGGAVIEGHVAPLDAAPENDHVAVAERFLNVPYLWGGRTSHGVDCSSLVQLALMAVGVPCPRDTDLQEAVLGSAVEGAAEAPRQPGDFVFWPGHVAIMLDNEYMIHASGHHMMVVIEPLAEAVERIAGKVGRPTSLRRL